MRSGYIYPGNTTGTFRYSGQGGRFWSSQGYSNSNHANDLSASTSISPSGYSERAAAFPLRCLSTALGM